MKRTKAYLKLCQVRGCRKPALVYPTDKGYVWLCPKHIKEWIKAGKL